MLLKAELRDRLVVIRKAFDKLIKEKEMVANKDVCNCSYRNADASGMIVRLRRKFYNTSRKKLRRMLTLRSWTLTAMRRYEFLLSGQASFIPSPRKILQNVVMQGRKLDKAVYVFSVDHDAGKVVHVNYVPERMRSNGLDGRVWAAKVTEILGGKVRRCSLFLRFSNCVFQAGGKEDSAQGVGTNVAKVEDAMVVVKEYFSEVVVI